ncbi:protein kinase HSL1 [Sugiyamaella lignohabitans]|uniref:non-specific serine/threonine protein kinase n=1 Tax=Sugiyamaella lignohabitans TaxID=796027 RepID=A0A167E8L5_9ASCO|nr:protein kinase HSL1 [Sugiyamaella lignohabitans]ANB13774.1 protein kinase HSL1 [Sugiyamaella lignohabitans]
MTTVAVAAAQAATHTASSGPAAGSDEAVKANHRLSQTSNHSSASKRSKSHVGPWRLGRTLGRGSSGRVRLAKHSLTGQLAAVKIVPKEIVVGGGSAGNGAATSPSANGGAGPGATAVVDATQYGSDPKDQGGLPYGIEREVIIMKLIEHPNVMALYDVWENKGELYLVLEYVEGGELFDYLIKKGRLDEREAVNYFRQIIYGVDYCHKFNICHRDLKPENLLLDKNRNIKIADFGMAALETSDRMLETSCGSPHYASPEIVAGKNYHGAPSDIWSCGVILFALLTGHLPFDDDNIRKLLLKVQTGKFIMPSDISSEAQDLIWRMLRVDPIKRISMAEILRHPLLKKYPVRKNGHHNTRLHQPVDTIFANADRPVKTVSDIDPEILKNLQILWHGASKKAVIEKLLAPGPNSEKTFYCLLMKYRHDHRQDEEYSNNKNNSVSRDNESSSHHHASRHNHTHTHHQSHHRKRSSQVSITLKKTAVRNAAGAAGPHSRNHSRSNSVASVITASSSHRRNVAFVRKRASSSHMRHQSGNTTPQKTTPPSSIIARNATTTTTTSTANPTSAGATTTSTEIETATTAVTAKPQVESLPIPRTYINQTPTPHLTPEEDFNFISKRASVELASMCEQAFFSTDLPSRTSDRAVSDPLSSIKAPKMATTEKRVFSLGEHEVNSVEPGSRPYSAYSTVSEASTTSTATPYFLPMIFEEDRFADAIEEEVDLKIYKRPNRAHDKRDTITQDYDYDYDYFKQESVLAQPKKRELVPPSAHTAVTKESSRLQISGLVKTDSFKARSHTGFAAYRTPSAPVPKPNPVVTTEPVLLISPSPPPSPIEATNSITTATGKDSSDNTTKPSQSDRRPNTANNNTKSSAKSTNRPATTTKQAPVVSTSTITTTNASKPISNPYKNSQVSQVQRTKTDPLKNHDQQPVSKPVRKPLAVKSNNIMITSNDVTDMSDLKSKEAAATAKPNAATSLFRRLTLNPRRPPPPPPPATAVSTTQPQAVRPAPPPPPAPTVATRTSSGKSNEVKQNWFMKMLNPNPQYTTRPTPSTAKKSQYATKTLFSTSSVTTMRHIIVEVLEDWQKYGISQINEDSVSSTVTAVISSRNVLSMRSAKFRINVYPMQGGTRAVFTQEKGSNTTFLRFLGELERALGEMDVLSPPRTDARTAIGLR